MKKLNRVAIAIAAAALATIAGAQEVHNWKSSAGDVWKNSVGQCWRDSSWTPATAAVGCDGAIVAPPPAPAPAPVVAPAPAPAPAPVSPEDNGVTPEQQAIIDQMLEIMKGLEGDTDPQTVAAITNAQERISAVKGSKEQAAMDAKVAADARDAAAKSPDWKAALAATGAGQLGTAPAEPKYGLTDREGRPIGTGTPGQYWNTQNESSDELSRWLKIARGR